MARGRRHERSRSSSAPTSRASASAATSSRCPTATRATSCCPRATRSRPPTVRSPRPGRCAGRATCATRRIATAPQTIATALVPKIITISAKSGHDGKLYGSVTAGRRGRARSRSRPTSSLDRKQTPHGADQDTRRAHGDCQAAQRRRVPDPHRSRQAASRRWLVVSTGLSTAPRQPRGHVAGAAAVVCAGRLVHTAAQPPQAEITGCCPSDPQARSGKGR